MDRPKKKSKKPPPHKFEDKNKTSSFNQDLKTIKENLRISEILRNVKISSSFRIKGPKGTKVMTDAMNDVTEKNITAEVSDNYVDASAESISDEEGVAKNTNIIPHVEQTEDHPEYDDDETEQNEQEDGSQHKTITSTGNVATETETELPYEVQTNLVEEWKAQRTVHNPTGIRNEEMYSEQPKVLEDIYESSATLPRKLSDSVKINRKLSLDNTSLRRKESLSKSEMDLNTVGKYPLQRKSSFFRKKLDSFVKNTSEVFKRQTSRQCNDEGRGSISYSLQSLNDKNVFLGDVLLDSKPQGSELESNSSMERASVTTSSVGSLAGSLAGSQQSQLDSTSSAQGSMHSLNELYVNDAPFSGRAFSYSSGLDSVHRPRRNQSTWNNRFTWLASDSVAEYLRRTVEAESSGGGAEARGGGDELAARELQASHSFQDFTRVADAVPPLKTDSKGRRLSYQRAVSGEDPVLPSRQYDSSFRRRNRISENAELQSNRELTLQLAEFSRNGVPPLKGFQLADISLDSISCVEWAEEPSNLEVVCDWNKLEPMEASRQAVIKELIATEAGYIMHLMAIVKVFMAAAHALQDSGKLLVLDTERLFSNIPDVLNSSLYFWDTAIYPMVSQATKNQTKYNTDLMYPGFFAFREIFGPYERYVSEQNSGIDYLRSLHGNADFTTYLNWCHRQKTCKRLQLADILVKPMQRLTKYSLILRRIITYTTDEEEKATLMAMKACTKTYVLDLNRTIRQKEEVEKMDKLVESIDAYDLDFKDDDMDRLFRMYANVNLKAPMVGCLPNHHRTLVYEGDLRFKDNAKEQKIDVRAILLTDMLIICKKMSTKAQCFPLKLIRPKYMVDRIMHYPQFKNPKNSKEMSSIICVVLDEVGSAYTSFSLSEPSKDSGSNSMKIWEQKIREAKLSYDLGVWFAKNPSRDISDLDMDNAEPRPGIRTNSDELSVEREARERVATMLHRNMGQSTEYDYSFASMHTDSFEGDGSAMSGGHQQHRHMMKRASTGGSSRNSRLSSFQQSTSAASHDEPVSVGKYSFRCGSSVEHLIVPQNPDDETRSITVNVITESESDTIVPTKPPSMPPYPSIPTAARSPSMSHHMLKVQPQCGVMALVHSLPDLTVDPTLRATETISIKTPSSASASPQSASDKLYQSHQETLNRNRLSARPASSGHFLSPDHRGTSYPPPSPTRASLRRGLAFSYSFKNPPLAKMGHVKSESHQPTAGEHGGGSGVGGGVGGGGGSGGGGSGGGGSGGGGSGGGGSGGGGSGGGGSGGGGSGSAAAGASGSASGGSGGGGNSGVAGQIKQTTASGYSKPSTSALHPTAEDKGAVNPVLVRSTSADKKTSTQFSSSFFTSGGWHAKTEG